MTTLREAANQALEALELVTDLTNHDDEIYDAIDALKAALAEPTLTQQMTDAGFTPRDNRLTCDECGGKFTRQMLPIHKCAALADPVQEPVAWIGYINGVANDLAFEPFDLDSDVKKPLFTAPPTLTDDQLDDIAVAARRGNLYDLRIAIERAHGIK